MEITKQILENLELQDIEEFDTLGYLKTYTAKCEKDGIKVGKYEMSIEISLKLEFMNKEFWGLDMPFFEVWLFEDGQEVLCAYDKDAIYNKLIEIAKEDFRY